MRVTILGSGSCGNATLVEGRSARVLIDAGVAPELLEERMRFALGEVVRPDAIILTHPHGDHACRAAACARRFEAPVYLSEACERRLTLDGAKRRVFGRSAPFDVGGLRVEPVPIPHDAPNVALVLDDGGVRAATLTDLGHIPAGLANALAGCRLVMLESNYDPNMLAKGPYPLSLRTRIASRTGHLSNQQAAQLLARLGAHTREVVLMHLSERCNTPMLALDAARRALASRSVRVEVKVSAASPDVPIVIEVERDPVPAARSTQLSLDLS
ncbi:MAG: MBL fold metallo-hydrolase [Sandaracinaceae bacterium]